MDKKKERELLAQWFAWMSASARTRITLANLKYDLSHKERVSLLRLIRVLRKMAKGGIWKPAATGGCDDAEGALNTFLNGAPESLFCQGPPIAQRGKLSLITDDAAFHKYYVRLSRSAIIVDRKTRLPRTRTILPKHVRRDAKVQSARNFAWVTDSDALHEQMTGLGRNRIPARVRDFLGLIFKKPNQHLIELRYPPDVAETLPLAAPTVLEGACVTVYKSQNGREGWGISLDLEHLRDGASEAVHRPIPFTSDFVYADLGPLADERVLTDTELSPLFNPPWTSDDDALVERLAKAEKKKK